MPLEREIDRRLRVSDPDRVRPRHWPEIVAAVAIAGVVLVRISNISLPYTAEADTLIATAAVAWGIDATLFALTAAVTALMLATGNDAERKARVREYRQTAFDPVAVFTVFALLWNGWVLLTLMDDKARSRPVDAGAFTSTAISTVLIIAGAAWLLWRSHHLVGSWRYERHRDLHRLLHVSLRRSAVAEMSAARLLEWGIEHGMQVGNLSRVSRSGFHEVQAEHSAHVVDVWRRPLARWLKRRPQGAQGTRAILAVSVGTVVQPGDPLVYILHTEGVRSIPGLLLRRPPSESDEFPDALGELEDDLTAAVAGGRLGAVRIGLDTVSSLFVQLLRSVGAVPRSEGGFTTALFGWPVETQLQLMLRRLGLRIARPGPTAELGVWLYFVQQTLQRTRRVGRDTAHLATLFMLWEIAAAQESVRSENLLWQRLGEYVSILEASFAVTTTARDLRYLIDEAREAMRFCGRLLTLLEADLVVRLIPIASDLECMTIPPVAGGATGDAGFDAVRAEAAQVTRTMADILWLGYVAWAYREWRAGRRGKEILAGAYETASQHFEKRVAGFTDARDACQVLCDDDPIGWDQLSSHEDLAVAQKRGQRSTAGFVNVYDGNAEALALVGFRLNGGAHSRGPGTSQALAGIKPHMGRLLELPSQQLGALRELGVLTSEAEMRAFIDGL